MKKTSFFKSFSIVSSSTLLSRILGLIRDIALASTFGASRILDAFVLAFTIPNLFRRFFGEGAFSAAFMPTFAKTLEQKGVKEAQSLASKAGTLLFIFLSICTVLGVFICLVASFYLGSPHEKLLFKLTALLLPYVILICMVAFLSAILQSFHHFLSPALAPIILNLFWLAGIFLLAPLWGNTPTDWIYAISISILIGGIFQVAIQLPVLKQKEMGLSFALHYKDKNIQHIINTLVPVILGTAAIQINIVLDRLIAWFFIPQEGALTVLYMGNRLMQFPLALIGISIATVIFPIFTSHAIKKQMAELGNSLLSSLRLTFFLSFPASLGLMVLADPIVTLLYQHNRFSADDALRTVHVLIFYSSGIWVFSLLQVVTKAFYALDDTKTPVKIASFAVLGNLILNLVLVQFMAEKGLALATVLSSAGNLLVLFVILKKRIAFSLEGMGIFFLKSIFCTAVMSLGVWQTLQFFLGFSGFIGQLLTVFVPIVVGIVIYFVMSILLQRKEAQQIVKRIVKR